MGKTTEKEALVCADCGTHIPPREGACGGPACGWTFDEPRRPIGYGCCAKRDAADMCATGRATLYLVEDPTSRTAAAKVTNWPGSLVFEATFRRRWTQYAPGAWSAVPCVCYDFTGPDGRTWSAIQRGDYNTIARCRRLERAPRRVR